MISLHEINNEIQKYESLNQTSIGKIESLAALYIVRDNLKHICDETQCVNGDKELTYDFNNEFCELANKLSKSDIIMLFDNVMSDIKILLPVQYDKVISKLRRLLD